MLKYQFGYMCDADQQATPETRIDFQNFFFSCKFLLSDFVMLNFVSIGKGIDITPSTSDKYLHDYNHGQHHIGNYLL